MQRISSACAARMQRTRGVHAAPVRARGSGRLRHPGRQRCSLAGCTAVGATWARRAVARSWVAGRVGGAELAATHRTRSSSMSQCKCIAAEAARFCTHISTPPKLASSSPQMWRTVSASSSWCDSAAPVSFLRGTQCGIAHQCARASTPVPVNSACHACSRRGGSGASSVGRRGFMGADARRPGKF